MPEQRQEPSKKVVYTLGTSTRSFDEFLRILKKYKIKQVIDVRSFPKSRRFPHFNQEILSKKLAEEGFYYVWLGKELGGFRREGYEKYMQTEDFAEGLNRLLALIEGDTSVIICAEKFPWRCHRRFISRKLSEKGIGVIHIIDDSQIWISQKLLGLI
ncbi:hypothetical protein Thein_0609 [Thermodesulfatator indicus DSM 15286]|uniref:DUF488 domain-containing protein n=1 Tax=Thermodesulfatator indicus (strain DSM 15286 / JCM 11887 / CIR29812) TaxID=667014 RepID=F8A885_THEID|nr:DUF488 domain-containing protein [Thermodesulfatator indicus]AEH44490.1 hypothetical protein Thein_0609 [Thermodesulfatator indicus DSM 15286]